LVQERIEEAEGSLASIKQLVVDERQQASKRRRRAGGAVYWRNCARAPTSVAVARIYEVVMAVECDIRIGSHGCVEGKRGGEVDGSFEICSHGSILIRLLWLERAKTASSGEGRAGFYAGSNFRSDGAVLSVRELRSADRGNERAAGRIICRENRPV